MMYLKKFLNKHVTIFPSRLESNGLAAVSVTCDGPSANKAMMSELGVNLDSRNIVPYFYSPGGKKVYFILDFPHMIKLVRNTLQKQQSIIDSRGRVIHWKYLVALEKLQSQEGLRCGNRITSSHINFQKSKMSVRLAVQLLSSSVADALEFCRDVLKLKEFEVDSLGTKLNGAVILFLWLQGCEATVEFIRRFDRLYDWGNSRNACIGGYKGPLRYNSHSYWSSFIDETYTYIQQLKNPQGICMDVINNTGTCFI